MWEEGVNGGMGAGWLVLVNMVKRDRCCSGRRLVAMQWQPLLRYVAGNGEKTLILIY